MRRKLFHSTRMEAERSSPHQIITATKGEICWNFCRLENNKTQTHFSRRRVDGIFFFFFSLEIIIFLGFNEKYWPLWLLERNHNNNKKKITLLRALVREREEACFAPPMALIGGTQRVKTPQNLTPKTLHCHFPPSTPTSYKCLFFVCYYFLLFIKSRKERNEQLVP